MTAQIRMVGATTATPREGDLARGWKVLLFWGGPLAWMVAVSFAGPFWKFSFQFFGGLLVLGTVWFGALCLVNALRCGRSHCWVDGTLLPALAVVGGLNLFQVLHLSWATYLSAFWSILVLSIVLECIVGSYSRRQTS